MLKSIKEFLAKSDLAPFYSEVLENYVLEGKRIDVIQHFYDCFQVRGSITYGDVQRYYSDEAASLTYDRIKKEFSGSGWNSNYIFCIRDSETRIGPYDRLSYVLLGKSSNFSKVDIEHMISRVSRMYTVK